ncbi:MAG: hypothetical protein E7346_04725 [Clostridiales bacterium]|nr:hypothetical protein [Clostridiales bacterium]
MKNLTALLEQLKLAQPIIDDNKNSNEKTCVNINFTQKEINKMPKTFRKEFRTDGCTARVYKRKVSKNAFTYDIKYRRNGYSVFVTDRNLESAKQKFIEKLKTAEKINKRTTVAPMTFNSFAMFHFENFRKKKVKEKTYENDLSRYKKYLKPYFEEKLLTKITSLECQDLIEEISNSGKGKTSEEIYSLMSIIFKAAIAHGILTKNPLDIVIHLKHDRKHGKALTKAEEKHLLESTVESEYQLMFAIALYTGLRPNEYETAKRDGEFIVAINSKRKNGKTEYKKIPITPMLKPYIKDNQEISFYKPYTLREKFNSILPNHILYDLRTTFYSRCIECGVSEIAQKLFVGHSLGELGNAYTDVSDEYLLKEGAKLNY